MEIRELVAADRDHATALWEVAGLTRPSNDPTTDFDRALAGPTSTVLGGFAGDTLVATIMVGHDGHRGWVYYLAVSATAQRQGFGRQMMRAAEERLRESGVAKCNLIVRRDNDDALGFYQQLDYEDAAVTVLGRWLV